MYYQDKINYRYNKDIALLTNEYGVEKEAPVGFSFTVLLFTFFVPLLRGDFKYTVVMLVIDIFTFGMCGILFGFIYNKLYIKDLLKKGYYPSTEKSREILISKGFMFSDK